MKKLFFFLFVVNSSLLFSQQVLEKIKYDELIYSFDSATAIIQKGKHSSIFNFVTETIIFGPVKSKLINFPFSNYYAEIPVEAGPIWIHKIDTTNIFSFKGSENSCYLGIDSPQNSDLIELNGKKFDQGKDDFLSDTKCDEFSWAFYKIEKSTEDNYIITSYQEEITYRNFQDEWIYNPGFNASGLYNIIEKNWIIQPKYKTCDLVNGSIFCLNADLAGTFFSEHDIPKLPPHNNRYDVYQLQTNAAHILQSGLTEIDEELLTKILNVDVVKKHENEPIYITQKNGKKGLVRFQLFEYYNPEEPDFYFTELIFPSADFIECSTIFNKVVTVYIDSLKPLAIYDYNFFQEKSSIIWRASDSVEVGIEYSYDAYIDLFMSTIITKDYEFNLVNELVNPEDTMRLDSICEACWHQVIRKSERSLNSVSVFGIELQNNGHLVLNNWLPPYSPHSEPLKSALYPEEDSLIIDPETGDLYNIYPSKKAGFSKGGVYDLLNQKWIIEPKYRILNPNDLYYFLITGYDDELDNKGCLVVDNLGNLIMSSLSYDQIYNDPNIFKYATKYPSDSIFIAPAGIKQHTKYQVPEYSKNNGYYVRSGNKLGLYQPGNELQNLWSESLYEFVHYNPDAEFTFYLEGDSVYCESPFDTLAVSRSGKIIFIKQKNDYTDPTKTYQIITIDNTDTVKTADIDSGNDFVQHTTTSSIEFKNGCIIVNDHTSPVEWNCVECVNDAGQYFGETVRYESENSSVWAFDGNKWRQVSQKYAAIEAIKNGWFIASTGSYYSAFDIYDSWDYGDGIDEKVTEIPSRYLLLDSNLNVIPYLDYFDFLLIEDLGFGLKVCMDNG